MRGVVLAGGAGTRLYPITKVVNKHLLPVYRKPMIFYPIETLIKGGINEILIVLGGQSPGEIFNLLRDGSDFGVTFSYKFQSEALGIANALYLAKDFVDDNFVAILGDNLFLDDISFSDKKSPHIFLTKSSCPERFGVVKIQGNKIVKIMEKPETSSSDLIATGLYVYPKSVFSVIENLKPSDRGEYEITDVNNSYDLNYTIVDKWFDMGEYDSLLEAANYLKENDGNC